MALSHWSEWASRVSLARCSIALTFLGFVGHAMMTCCWPVSLSVAMSSAEMMLSSSMVLLHFLEAVERPPCHCELKRRQKSADTTQIMLLRVDSRRAVPLLERRSFDRVQVEDMDDAWDGDRAMPKATESCPAATDKDCSCSSTSSKAPLCSLYSPCRPTTIFSAW